MPDSSPRLMSPVATGRKLNGAIADLYDAALGVRLEDFRALAFGILGRFVPFDSAVWASGRRFTQGGRELSAIHTMHLIGQPESVPFRFADEFVDADEIYRFANASPGVPMRIEDTISLNEYRSSSLYLDFTRHHGIELAMGTVHINEIMDFFDYMTLWRSNRDDLFSDFERLAKQTLALHMVNAWKHCQLQELQRTDFASSDQVTMMRRARALVDDKGAIYAADSEFGYMLQDVFPRWRGSDLPYEFSHFVSSGLGSTVIGGIDCRISRSPTLHVITIASASKSMPLSISEFDVARLYCSGFSNSEIARQRGVSATTVRNQLASIYRKLEVHSKIDLARLIN